jgi:hypothetical protein
VEGNAGKKFGVRWYEKWYEKFGENEPKPNF